jgi:UDP-N-acetylmuramoyl-L-alanyl-D-glutamate--2,6-diaminopimelate ligase
MPITLGELFERLAWAGQMAGIVTEEGCWELPGELGWRGAGQWRGIGAELIPSSLSYDSRDVEAGALFFCKGAGFKPEYLAAAEAAGALAYVSEARQDSSLPGLLVHDVRRAMALAALWYYEGVVERLSIVGVTGTKGKSTTVYFLKSILDTWMRSLGKPETAILSSIDNYDGVVFEESHLTTKESLDLYRHFANAVASGISHLSMEASSQGLKYDRVTSVPFAVGCFLNFGRDHISAIEHSDREDYLAAKLRIFDLSQVACVNLGSEEVERVLAAAAASERLVTLGWQAGADLQVVSHRDLGVGGSEFTAQVFGQAVDFTLGLAGYFNVENALAAMAASLCLGVPMPDIQAGLAAARVPGRMEPFEAPDGKLVLVDYAHNLMSFEALFAAVKASYPDSYIAIVFGCPGYKANDRRHDLGMVAGREADDVVLTEEDAGYELVMGICEEIAEHVRQAGGSPRIILDREEAIESAIESAPPGAVVLVTGKGRETRQKRGSEYVEVPSDVAIVEAYIARQGPRP